MPLPPPLEPSFDDAARPFYHHHQSATLTLADSDTRRSSSGHVSPSTYSVSSSGSVANNIRSASSGYASSADSPPQTVQVLSTSNSESSLAAASRVPKKVVARRRTSPRHHMATAGKEYTVEQLDFIRYMKVDQKRTWREVAALHNERWPPIISSSSSSSPANVTSSAASAALRTEQGVNGVFYRKNARVPALDDATGLPILDEEGNIVYTAEKVRSQMALGRLRGLLNTWPERAVGYEWVDEKDRELAAATSKLLDPTDDDA